MGIYPVLRGKFWNYIFSIKKARHMKSYNCKTDKSGHNSLQLIFTLQKNSFFLIAFQKYSYLCINFQEYILLLKIRL